MADILEKRFPPPSLLKVLEMLKFNENPLQLVGSGSLLSQQYPADYDLLTVVRDKDLTPQRIYKVFSKILNTVANSPTIYFIESKIQNKDGKKFKVFTFDEFSQGWFLENFNPKEISYVKFDFVIAEQIGYVAGPNVFKECSVIYMFDQMPIDVEKYQNGLLEDMKELISEGKYYKSLKRLLSIIRYKAVPDKPFLIKMSKLFNSSVGKLYLLKNQLDAVKLVHDKYKLPMVTRRLEMFMHDNDLNGQLENIEKISEEYGKLIDAETKKWFAKNKVPEKIKQILAQENKSAGQTIVGGGTPRSPQQRSCKPTTSGIGGSIGSFFQSLGAPIVNALGFETQDQEDEEAAEAAKEADEADTAAQAAVVAKYQSMPQSDVETKLLQLKNNVDNLSEGTKRVMAVSALDRWIQQAVQKYPAYFTKAYFQSKGLLSPDYLPYKNGQRQTWADIGLKTLDGSGLLGQNKNTYTPREKAPTTPATLARAVGSVGSGALSGSIGRLPLLAALMARRIATPSGGDADLNYNGKDLKIRSLRYEGKIKKSKNIPKALKFTPMKEMADDRNYFSSK
jgi:hypothetical protein